MILIVLLRFEVSVELFFFFFLWKVSVEPKQLQVIPISQIRVLL